MNKIRDHISTSKTIIKCKNCKCLKIPKYLDDIFCEKCNKEYTSLCNKIMHKT